MEKQNVSRQRGFKQTRTLSVLLLAGDIQCKGAFENAARVCARSQQQLEAVGGEADFETYCKNLPVR